MPTATPTLLVVDDTAAIIDILLDALGDDYHVRVAIDGPGALRSVEKSLPDLILLDIMMPGMDGYEVCRRLKGASRTRDIPILFLSALNETADQVCGLSLGAVDYITKPFNIELVKARIRTHLELKRYRDDLSLLVQQRTQDLMQAHERLKAIECAQADYLAAISHELRTPMNGVMGIAELALHELEEPLQSRYRKIFEASRQRILTDLDSVLLLKKIQSDAADIQTETLSIGHLLNQALQALQGDFDDRKQIVNAPSMTPGQVIGNAELLRQTLTTLLKIAMRLAARETAIDIVYEHEHEHENAWLAVRIVYQGAALTDELECAFFDTVSFERACSYVEDMGFTVPLAAYAARAMGGSAEICNTPGGGQIILKIRRIE